MALLTGVGVCLLGLPLGAAVFAQRDSRARQIRSSRAMCRWSIPFDSKPLRFSRTGEARWNDGTAFPFVMLGLGLFGAHDMAWGVALGRH